MAQTPIYIDEQNRRRRDDGEGSKNPEMAKLEQTITAQKAEIAQLKSKLETVEDAEICGDGFSGNIESGISFDPTTIATTNEGQWRNYTDCEGNTMDVWVRNFIPPP